MSGVQDADEEHSYGSDGDDGAVECDLVDHDVTFR